MGFIGDIVREVIFVFMLIFSIIFLVEYVSNASGLFAVELWVFLAVSIVGIIANIFIMIYNAKNRFSSQPDPIKRFVSMLLDPIFLIQILLSGSALFWGALLDTGGDLILKQANPLKYLAKLSVVIQFLLIGGIVLGVIISISSGWIFDAFVALLDILKASFPEAESTITQVSLMVSGLSGTVETLMQNLGGLGMPI